jgi:basic membrane lipoprotein Med (substrate-binding protein (PBP1-ABC) superfamily)
MKNQRLISEQYRKAQYNRNVCKYSGRIEEAAYWNGYVQALSLIIETEK